MNSFRKKKPVEIRKIEEEKLLEEIIMKIELERVDMQEEITVEVLLNTRTTELVISLEFARKKRLKQRQIFTIRDIEEQKQI